MVFRQYLRRAAVVTVGGLRNALVHDGQGSLCGPVQGGQKILFLFGGEAGQYMICQILVAYPLSKRNYQAKNLVQRIMLVAMLTGAGLVPSFLMRVWFRMNNTIWAIILSGLTPINHIFIMRTSFKTSVPGELLDAAKIDGASRWRRVLSVDLPAIMPTVSIMLILRFGSVMSVGYEKVYLMQNDLNMDVAEVISTYVYKMGLLNKQYSFSTAVGLLNNVVNFTLLIVVNKISSKVSETSLF